MVVALYRESLWCVDLLHINMFYVLTNRNNLLPVLLLKYKYFNVKQQDLQQVWQQVRQQNFVAAAVAAAEILLLAAKYLLPATAIEV